MGQRLYAYHELDHEYLFKLLAQADQTFMMTYNTDPKIESLIATFGFHAVSVTMNNAHYTSRCELIITPEPTFTSHTAEAKQTSCLLSESKVSIPVRP